MALDRNGQYEVDGLLMGLGTPYVVETVVGLGGIPEVKHVDRDLGDTDGGYAGSDYLAPREVVMAVGLDGEPETEAYDDLIAALGQVFRPRRVSEGSVVFRWQRFGRIRRLTARPRGLILPWDEDFFMGAGRAAVRLIAHDPVVYSDTVETEGPSTGAVAVTNLGNYPVWPVITTAAGGDISLTNTTTGEAVVFTGLPSATVIDFKARTAETTVGDVDVYSTVNAAPAWWQVQPGLNDLEFSADATIEFRHGWTTG